MTILLILLVSSACRKGNEAPTRTESIQRGDELVERKQYPDAITAYRTAVDGDPRDGETRLKLARAYLQAGDWLKAAPEAIRAADLLPDNSDAQQLAIAMMLGHQRFEDALDRAAARLRIEPDRAALFILFGNAKARLSNSWSALLTLDEAMRLGKNYDQIRADLRPMTRQADDRAAEEAFRRALELDASSVEARLALASFYWAVGRPEEAEEPLRWVADRHPDYVLGNRALGLFYASRGRQTEAEKYLKVAAANNDRDSQLVLADYYLQRNRDEEALPVLDKMAAGDDPDGAAALRAADIEFRSGRREQAMQRAEKVLARDPGNAPALRIKAQALFAVRDFSQAMKVARAAVAAEPGSREARSVLARSLAATGDPASAFAEFAELWRLNSGDAETAKEMAGLALALDRGQVALEFATIAKQKLPNDPSVSDILGWAYVRNGAPTRGIPHLEDAVRAESASALFRYHLGIAHYRMREFPQAREELTRALGLDPSFPGAPDAQKVLNRLAR